MDDVAAWFLALYKTTGIKLTIFYDAYDRGRFLQGIVATLKLSAYCLVGSLILGALVAMLQGARIAAVRRGATAFVELFRNTPPLVQLYFFYFALGPLLPRVGGQPPLGSFGWAVVSLTLLETAFAAEIYRAGIEAVPKEMVEAAASLGFSRPRVYQRVVLPLALRATMPAMTNNLVNLVKTTTLAYAIAVPELVYMSAQVWSEQVNVPEMMVVLLICYVAIVGAINQFMQWLEARLRVPGFGQ
ncbi:MAG TPA: amino acid ABC transporter permease [Gemmatimonadaceae bacterium]|nr:amino acid ABC transporter permease [Gemmatimonadaceae bacterium]